MNSGDVAFILEWAVFPLIIWCGEVPFLCFGVGNFLLLGLCMVVVFVGLFRELPSRQWCMFALGVFLSPLGCLWWLCLLVHWSGCGSVVFLLVLFRAGCCHE